MCEHEIKENLLDFVGYHKKWHGNVQDFRQPYKFNQNDYIIEEIFHRIGIEKGFFVEFGAWDGVFGSNTRKLFLSGWNGILIEPDDKRFSNLQNNYRNDEGVITLKSFIDLKDNLFDDVVGKFVTDKINFCSIDIDGLDVEVFETIKIHLPDVVCIEGGQMLNPIRKSRLPPDVAKHNIQQSLYVMNEIFQSRGYKLLCTYQDSFFIKEEYYHLFNVKEDIFELYLDGILSYPRLPWIQQQLNSVGLKNELLEIIYRKVPLCSARASVQEKVRWSDEQYSAISQVIEEIRLLRKNQINKATET
tara:strand:+ start:1236 stop:2144 length:909 start_codon:yes stop_codon:yes gene_type:complete